VPNQVQRSSSNPVHVEPFINKVNRRLQVTNVPRHAHFSSGLPVSIQYPTVYQLRVQQIKITRRTIAIATMDRMSDDDSFVVFRRVRRMQTSPTHHLRSIERVLLHSLHNHVLPMTPNGRRDMQHEGKHDAVPPSSFPMS